MIVLRTTFGSALPHESSDLSYPGLQKGEPIECISELLPQVTGELQTWKVTQRSLLVSLLLSLPSLSPATVIMEIRLDKA